MVHVLNCITHIVIADRSLAIRHQVNKLPGYLKTLSGSPYTGYSTMTNPTQKPKAWVTLLTNPEYVASKFKNLLRYTTPVGQS